MVNRTTDGLFEDESPGWLERILAAVLTAGLLVAARSIGVLSWPRISWLLPCITITATAFVWFPEFVAGLASASSPGDSDAPPTAVRVIGWGVLIAVGMVLGVIWVSVR